MNEFEENFNFQKNYYQQIESILKRSGQHFIRIEVADEYKDTKLATDFVVVIKGGDVAVRIRRANISYRDFTIRSICRGYKTELDKIKVGFGKYYLYCWENSHKNLDSWILVDLDKFRESKLINTDRNDIPNSDGTYFRAYELIELYNTNCLLAHQGVSI